MSDEKPPNFQSAKFLYDYQFKKIAEELTEFRKDVKSDLKDIKRDIVGLKIKTAIWGATAALIISIVSHLVSPGSLPDIKLKAQGQHIERHLEE